jgi:hypothetical protein
MLRPVLLALVLGFGIPHLSGFDDLFTAVWAPNAVEIGIGWDPWGGGDGAEAGAGYDPNGSSAEDDLGHGIDPWG